ncbi:SNARE complex subunit (Syn8)-like protein [Coleophoma crateriformis]|uniref:SNARE complex subunit (Syn8)-like protein n=1 Tax=Coleophoma crateriformis TaxID=565419 RepID=A0A3D8SHF8_9HELO|nr:SNARE complex subunit (Syn8)-like protein [Coleophoma crateriformis]
MANPNQYFLLADHIKLSLLERQRAISLNLEPTSQDGHISRSLESLREGLEKVTQERERLEAAGETSASLTLQETEHSLKLQYEDLSSQFHGVPTDADTLTHPNDPALAGDFARASHRPDMTTSSSFKKGPRGNQNTTPSKSVRFSDNPLSQDDENREALFPYRDEPSPGPPDQSHLDNQQIHEYHSQVIADQDAALDRLGESIGRQRELTIMIGDELDEHVQMLDEVDGHVDRHQNTLNRARKNLGTVARKAKDNMQMTIILILIIILVLLIIILK